VPRSAAEVLDEYGWTGDRLLRLCRRVANDELRRRGAFLDADRFDDLVGFLVLRALAAVVKYDPVRVRQSSYGSGGGEPLESYLSDVLARRIWDWYRSKGEGNCDRRYFAERPLMVTYELVEGEVDRPADVLEVEIAAQQTERGQDWEDAERAVAERYPELSEEARRGLHLLRLRAEGYRVCGKGTQRPQRVALAELQRLGRR
jgi:hypothetical protein